MASARARRRLSVRVRADDLAAGGRGQLLIEPELGAGHDGPAEAARRLHRDADREAPDGVQLPAIDRLLQEPDGAVREGEIGTAGMEARGRAGVGVRVAVILVESDIEDLV